MALKKVTTISPLISIWMVKPLLFFKVPFVGWKLYTKISNYVLMPSERQKLKAIYFDTSWEHKYTDTCVHSFISNSL